MNTTNHARTVWGLCLAACLTLLAQAAQAGVAGHVQFVHGQAQVTDAAGKARSLHKRDAVHEGDTITTAKNSTVQIRMRDGAMLAVRPDSRLKIDRFVFSGTEDGNERSFFSLLKGGLRSITGTIGQKNKSSFQLASAASTIGIRGTDHETYVIVPGSDMAAIAPAGTYNRVNSGETTMTTEKGTIHILPNQMGYAAGADQMPQLLPVNPAIFAAAPAPLSGSGGDTIAEQGRESTAADASVDESPVAPGSTVPTPPTLAPITEDRGPTTAPRVF